MATLKSDKTDFKSKEVIKDKDHCILIKDSIQQNIIYTPTDKPSKYMKQKMTELKGEIHSSTIMFGDFSTPLNNV